MIGLDLVRVQLLVRRVYVSQIGMRSPVDQVVRRRCANRPDTGRLPFFLRRDTGGKDSPVGAILANRRIPKRQVLRIECAEPLRIGSSVIGDQCIPSGDLNGSNPLGLDERKIAL